MSQAIGNMITVKEAARLLGVDIKTVYRWIHKGELLAYRHGSKRGVLMIPEVELHRFMADSALYRAHWEVNDFVEALVAQWLRAVGGKPLDVVYWLAYGTTRFRQQHPDLARQRDFGLYMLVPVGS